MTAVDPSTTHHAAFTSEQKVQLPEAWFTRIVYVRKSIQLLRCSNMEKLGFSTTLSLDVTSGGYPSPT